MTPSVQPSNNCPWSNRMCSHILFAFSTWVTGNRHQNGKKDHFCSVITSVGQSGKCIGAWMSMCGLSPQNRELQHRHHWRRGKSRALASSYLVQALPLRLTVLHQTSCLISYDSVSSSAIGSYKDAYTLKSEDYKGKSGKSFQNISWHVINALAIVVIHSCEKYKKSIQ